MFVISDHKVDTEVSLNVVIQQSTLLPCNNGIRQGEFSLYLNDLEDYYLAMDVKGFPPQQTTKITQ